MDESGLSGYLADTNVSSSEEDEEDEALVQSPHPYKSLSSQRALSGRIGDPVLAVVPSSTPCENVVSSVAYACLGGFSALREGLF